MSGQGVPYHAKLITKLLRGMPDVRLAKISHRTFQTYPAAHIERAAVIQELIANERSRRAAQNGGNRG